MIKPTHLARRHQWTLWTRRIATSGIACLSPLFPAKAVGWAEGCLPFIPAAEQYYHLPKGLLLAIALTESGQEGSPHPWALNIAGRPVIAPTYQAAAASLRSADGQPRRDVAIGCMQIHMQYHLDRFVEPEWALHPRYNVWYAALFLDTLHRQYGNILSAIAHYHGSDPAAQRDYLCRVSSHLARTAPATRETLGLGSCERIKLDGHITISAASIQRKEQTSLMAARRVGRIIVLGADRP